MDYCKWCGLEIKNIPSWMQANHVQWCPKNPKADYYRSLNVTKRRNASRKAAIASHKSNRMGLGQAKMMGKLSRAYENMVASKLHYDEIFQPNEVCDRIAFQNGEIIFIEIKQKGRKLTLKQQRFKELVGDKFKVIYGE